MTYLLARAQTVVDEQCKTSGYILSSRNWKGTEDIPKKFLLVVETLTSGSHCLTVAAPVPAYTTVNLYILYSLWEFQQLLSREEECVYSFHNNWGTRATEGHTLDLQALIRCHDLRVYFAPLSPYCGYTVLCFGPCEKNSTSTSQDHEKDSDWVTQSLWFTATMTARVLDLCVCYILSYNASCLQPSTYH